MKTNVIKLDKKDKKILEMLKEDCKMPVKTIAKTVGSPITTVYSKIKKMEKLGIIKGYKAIIDDKKMGLGVTAFICISCMPNQSKTSNIQVDNNSITRKLLEIPEIEKIYMITGPWDVIVKVKAENVEGLGEIAFNKIRAIEGITNTLTLVSVADIKP